MRKKFTIFLILVFVLGLTPVNFSQAITQNQIDAEVQIVCTDGSDNWFSGSGTIIDPKGIILTNRHVIEGADQNVCLIGFTESISQGPNFGTEDNPNLAEVKYYTTTDDMDAAILYLDNPSNKTYPYVNIWDSNSSSLNLGDGIEVIGYPSIGGNTLTYVNGVMSGVYGNYIKTTAPIEHGNSGGSAYNFNGDFIGIPTAVVKGELNSLSFILSVNKIKEWLSNILGTDFINKIDSYNPPVINQQISLNNDLTPPNSQNVTATVCAEWKCEIPIDFENSWSINYPYFSWSGFSDPSGIDGYYVYIGKNFNAQPTKDGQYINNNKYGGLGSGQRLTDSGIYYLKVQAKDKVGNISNPVYWTYYFNTSENLGTVNYGESDSAKSLANRPTKFYIYSYDNGYKGDLLRVVYLDSSHIQRFDLPTNNLYIEWDSTKERGFITEEEVIFTEDGGYYPGNWNYECGEKYYYGDKNIYIDCTRKGNRTELHSWGNNHITSTNLKVGQKYDFNFTGYFTKNGKLTSAYYFAVFEATPTKNIIFKESDLGNKLSGQILLQVEAHGEAYYINPKNSLRYYMADGNEAYRIMRNLGVGITNNDLEKVKINKYFAKQHSGKIFLQVEAHGEAYYIDFDGDAHYLKDGNAAYNIMRDLGLGITNGDLNKIPEGNL